MDKMFLNTPLNKCQVCSDTPILTNNNKLILKREQRLTLLPMLMKILVKLMSTTVDNPLYIFSLAYEMKPMVIALNPCF